MKIFVPGAYTWGNKGDAALVNGFLEWLRADFSASEVELTSFTPALDQQHYGVRVHHMVVRPMALWRRGADIALSRSARLRFLLSRYRLLAARVSYLWIPIWVSMYRKAPSIARLLGFRSLWSLTRSIDSADLVFTVPGGYLLAPREVDDWWLYHVPNIFLAKALGRPVILGPSSIGPFAPGHKKAAARLLANVDLIILREELSRPFVAELGVREHSILVSPDIAFRHAPDALGAAGTRLRREISDARRTREGVVGVSVRQHSFPGSMQPKADFARYLGAVEEALAQLYLDGALVVVFSQTEEDWAVSQLLSSMLSKRSVPHILADPSLTPSDLQRLYGELDLLVGTRMHANILALTMGTPVVAIAYEPKTMGILRSIGLEDWGVWIDEVDSETMVERSMAAWSDRLDRRTAVRAAQAGLDDKFSQVAGEVSSRLG